MKHSGYPQQPMPIQLEPLVGAPQQYVLQPVQPQQYVPAVQPQQLAYIPGPPSEQCCPIRPPPTTKEGLHTSEKVVTFFNGVRILACLIYFVGIGMGGSWFWREFIIGPLISVVMGILLYVAVFALREPSQWIHRRNMYISVSVFDLGTLLPIIMGAAFDSDGYYCGGYDEYADYTYGGCKGRGAVLAGGYMAAISQIIIASLCLSYTCPPCARHLKQGQEVAYINAGGQQIQPQIAIAGMMHPVQQQGQIVYGQPQLVQPQFAQPQPVQPQLVPQPEQQQLVQPQVALTHVTPQQVTLEHSSPGDENVHR